MSVGCLVITTNLPHRLEWTFRLLDSIESANWDTLKEKVLSVDLQPGVSGCEDHLHGWCREHGWQMVTGECTGERAMLHNIQRGLEYIDTDYLFYCEDHVVIEDIPTEETLHNLWVRYGIGWINYNTHVHEENLMSIDDFVESPGREERLAYVNDVRNWVQTNDGDFLIKGAAIQDEYTLCFPASIMPLKYFRELMRYGLENYSGVGIEIGFTKAWYELDLDYGQYAAIYTSAGTVDQLPFDSFHDLHMRACMRFRNNDQQMLHDSIVPHDSTPKDKEQRRSFF